MHNPLTILLYHGVSSESNIGIENYSGKHINTKIFENDGIGVMAQVGAGIRLERCVVVVFLK